MLQAAGTQILECGSRRAAFLPGPAGAPSSDSLGQPVGSWDRRAKGEGSGAALRGVAGAARLDTSLRGSVFLLSIINRSGRIGVLAIGQAARPNTPLWEARRRRAQGEARSIWRGAKALALT